MAMFGQAIVSAQRRDFESIIKKGENQIKKQIKKQWFVVGLVGLAIAGSIFTAGNAGAAEPGNHALSNMNVTASILANPASCTVIAAGPAFSGTRPDIGGNNHAANGDIRVTCSTGTVYKIALNGGLNDNNDGSDMRAMSNGAGSFISYRLEYELNGAVTGNDWGDDVTNGSSLAGLIGTSLEQRFPVYGLNFVFPDAVLGTYSDTVVVTVHF